MPADPAASIAGVSMRVTRLDENGNLLGGEFDSYTTSAFIRVSFTPEYEEGDEITEKAADGTVCVSYKAPDTLKRVNMEIAICDPDPEMSNLLSGGLLLSGQAGGKEVALGWASAQVGEDPTGNGVAVEVWSRAIKDGKPARENPYFHWVFPFVKTRLSGDRVIENGLMATTFEGYGVGNINFRNGPDHTWRWPAAADRPYLYARTPYAPQGLRGFYRWNPASFDDTNPSNNVAPGAIMASNTFLNIDASAPVGSGVPSQNRHGINVPSSRDPYMFRSDAVPAEGGFDAVLSSQDYEPNESGTAVFPATADGQTVKNVPPSSALHNPVTYKQRFKATISLQGPGTMSQMIGPMQHDATALNNMKTSGTLDVPNSQTAWLPGQYVQTTDGIGAHWNGTAFEAGRGYDKGAAAPGNVYPPDVSVLNAGTLPAGYKALDPHNSWDTGQYMKIGSVEVYWDGFSWKDGRAPASTKATLRPGDNFGQDLNVTDAASMLAHGYRPLVATAWTGGYVTLNGHRYSWNGTAWVDHVVAITGVTAGAPGSFQPADADLPADLTALKGNAVVGTTGSAKPSTKWTTGQYVLLGDNTKAHWSGSAWVAGEAQ